MMRRKTAIAMGLLIFLALVLVYNLAFSLLHSAGKTYRVQDDWNITSLSAHIYRNPYDYLINTPACFIPDYSNAMKFDEPLKPQSCRKRIVIVTLTADDEITFTIEQSKRKSLRCCYNFIDPIVEDFRLTYSKCQYFNSGDKVSLENEIVEVSCMIQTRSNMSIMNYKHTYQFPKRDMVQTLKDDAVEDRRHWNVIVVGVEGMSRARAYAHMPNATRYMKRRNWLDFRGYNKVAEDTFDNILGLITGMNHSSVKEALYEGLDNNLMIWTKFREAGYFTAFGEDNILLPKTLFGGRVDVTAVDHYYKRAVDVPRLGKLICADRESLEYAAQFAKLYKHDKFFGFFWIHSLHNYNYTSHFKDRIFVPFFKRLSNFGVLNNTFVILLSDSGVRYGKHRVLVKESYYDNSLPMLFMYVPEPFREAYPEEYDTLQMNQGRLVTPYDVHVTLQSILKFSVAVDRRDRIHSEACPGCKGLTEEIYKGRTCEDAYIEERWCTCFETIPINNNEAAQRSIATVMNELKSLTETTHTIHCTKCARLSLKSIVRHEWYRSGDKKYYVIVFKVNPRDITFAAKIENAGGDYQVLFPIENLTPGNLRNGCVNNTDHAYDFALPYCVCTQVFNCGSKITAGASHKMFD